MIRRGSAWILLAVLLASSTGLALALHHHDGTHPPHGPVDGSHVCLICYLLTSGATALVDTPTAGLTGQLLVLFELGIPAADPVCADRHEPMSARAPPSC
ncbi:MAG: hypothetical protein AMXMBFR13_41780 [Phycisphaerae bacterium]